jgi:hypothetical protein
MEKHTQPKQRHCSRPNRYVALRDSKRHANITPGLFNYEERGFQKGQRLLTAAGVRIVPKNCKKLQKNIPPEPHD